MSIRYVVGDATAPQTTGPACIVHVCNDVGGWGKGFVMALSARCKAPEQSYRSWYRARRGFELGAVQFVEVAQDLHVANLIGQHGIKARPDDSPIRYPAFDKGLKRVGEWARNAGASVHMPRIGCGLAGGTWDRIEPLLVANLDGLDVTVYDRGP